MASLCSGSLPRAFLGEQHSFSNKSQLIGNGMQRHRIRWKDNHKPPLMCGLTVSLHSSSPLHHSSSLVLPITPPLCSPITPPLLSPTPSLLLSGPTPITPPLWSSHHSSTLVPPSLLHSGLPITPFLFIFLIHMFSPCLLTVYLLNISL